MSMITTRCPRTWREIATGIDTTPKATQPFPTFPPNCHAPLAASSTHGASRRLGWHTKQS